MKSGYMQCKRFGQKGYKVTHRHPEYFTESFFCYHCGYAKLATGRLDETRSNSATRSLTESTAEVKSYGVFMIKGQNGECMFGPLYKSPDQIQEAVNLVQTFLRQLEADPNGCYVTAWDANKGKVIYLISNANIADQAMKSNS